MVLMNWLKGKIKENLQISQKEIAIRIGILQEHVSHFIDIRRFLHSGLCAHDRDESSKT